jgi:hypothetical protein
MFLNNLLKWLAVSILDYPYPVLIKQLWVHLTQQSTVCRLMMIEMIETSCGTNIRRGEEELLR